MYCSMCSGPWPCTEDHGVVASPMRNPIVIYADPEPRHGVFGAFCSICGGPWPCHEHEVAANPVSEYPVGRVQYCPVCGGRCPCSEHEVMESSSFPNSIAVTMAMDVEPEPAIIIGDHPEWVGPESWYATIPRSQRQRVAGMYCSICGDMWECQQHIHSARPVTYVEWLAERGRKCSPFWGVQLSWSDDDLYPVECWVKCWLCDGKGNRQCYRPGDTADATTEGLTCMKCDACDGKGKRYVP